MQCSGIRGVSAMVQSGTRRLVQRHQMVYEALGDRMKAEIHALSIKAFTPAEFAEKSGQ